MQRKLIKQGVGGYTIYLPKRWVERKGLDAGDTIEVTESGTDLLLHSAKREMLELRITLDEKSRRDVVNLLTHAYRRGYDRIVMEGIDERAVKEVSALVDDSLIGFEIVESDIRIVVENISEPAEDRYDVLKRRVFLIIKQMQEDVHSAISKGVYQYDVVSDVMRIDSYILFCRRMLSKELHSAQVMLEWEQLTFVMHISHAYHYLYAYAKSQKITYACSSFPVLCENFDLLYQSVFKRDRAGIHKINSDAHKIHFSTIPQALARSRGAKSVVLSYVREISRLIQIGTSPVLAALLAEDSP